MTMDHYEPWKLTPFEKWVQDEGIHVVTQERVPDIDAVELLPWERTGCRAAFLDLTFEPLVGSLVNNQSTIRYLCDIPPGGTYKAEKHMYEEIFYVVKGRGATTVWNEGGPKQTFEWKEGSVFSIPLNAWHALYNGQGHEAARLYAATNAATAFNLYASPEFIFGCPMTFTDRYSGTDGQYFGGEARKLEDRYSETNFIPDAHAVSLDLALNRGFGSSMVYSMAGGHFVCHISDFPPGTYKKAHVGGAPANRAGLASAVAYLFLSGEGYDLQWPPGVKPGPGVPWERIDYRKGTLVAPGTGYHQHFNVSTEPIRYIVLRYGNPRYLGAAGARFRESGGGTNIEFEDEDPTIREQFNEELRKRNIEPSMPPRSA